MTRSEYINELAARILAENRKEVSEKPKSERMSFPYYLLNVQQRAMHGLYVQFLAEKGVQYGPPGDIERLCWELNMLSNDALRKVGEFYKHKEGESE